MICQRWKSVCFISLQKSLSLLEFNLFSCLLGLWEVQENIFCILSNLLFWDLLHQKDVLIRGGGKMAGKNLIGLVMIDLHQMFFPVSVSLHRGWHYDLASPGIGRVRMSYQEDVQLTKTLVCNGLQIISKTILKRKTCTHGKKFKQWVYNKK